MTTRLRGALAIMASLAVVEPALAQNRREMQMMADIRMLQEQTQQLQQQLQTAIATLADALKGINGRIDDQANATRKAFADQKLTVDQLGNDLRVVRERVDETNVRIGSVSQELEALRLSIPQYPPPAPVMPADPSAAGFVPPGGVPGMPAPPPVPAPAPPPAGPGMSPQRLYDTAWTDYTAGQWALCIGGFEQYLRSFPRSDQADNAQYYVGLCHASDGKLAEAVEAYNQVIANYPKSDAAPLAYYQRGAAYERLGQNDRAKESYESLIKMFPDSDAARLAKQSVDRLNRGRPNEPS